MTDTMNMTTNELQIGTHVHFSSGKAFWIVEKIWHDGQVTITSNNGRSRIVPAEQLTVGYPK